MTDRDMSYELDAAFASRNDGEMQNLAPARTRLARSPGVNVRQPNADDMDDVNLFHNEDQDLTDARPVRALGQPGGLRQTVLRDAARDQNLDPRLFAPAQDMAGLEISVPVLGTVNLLHVGMAVGLTILVCKLAKKG